MPQRGAGASRKRDGAGGGLGPRAGNGGGRLSVRKRRGSHTTQPLPWLRTLYAKIQKKCGKRAATMPSADKQAQSHTITATPHSPAAIAL